ncbi:MAG: TIGR04283 family arsenosugar biosynthesis glycosyltransferase [bacterium]
MIGTSGGTPTLSIIIPILNEEECLPALMRDIDDCIENVDFPLECIIVDGNSEDSSVEICKRHNLRVVVSPRGRGQQLVAGAQHASGEIFLFLHADCRLTPDHCLTAVKVVQHNDVVAGGFRLRFDDSHPVLRFAEKINLIRFRLTKIIYGDHGLFIRKQTYETVGGFSAQSLFEDVDFSRKLKKAGRVVLTSPEMVTSARRFRKGGVIRTYLKMASLHILHWISVSPEYLAQLYRNERRKKEE